MQQLEAIDDQILVLAERDGRTPSTPSFRPICCVEAGADQTRITVFM
jgi:hypothetical protein